jgi:hypothetical protein
LYQKHSYSQVSAVGPSPIEHIWIKAHAPSALSLLPFPYVTPPMMTAGIKRILQGKTDPTNPFPSQALVPVASLLPETSPEFPGLMTNEVTAATLCDFPSHDPDVSPCEKPTDKPSPRLTKLMNPKFFEKSAMCTAWQAQKEQKFGKDNLHQVFTTERVFPHVVFFLLKYEFLDSDDRTNLFEAMPST